MILSSTPRRRRRRRRQRWPRCRRQRSSRGENLLRWWCDIFLELEQKLLQPAVDSKKSRCYEKGFKDNQNEEVKLVKIKITTVSCEANVVMQLSRVFKKNKEDRQTEQKQKQKQCCAKIQADKQTTNIARKSFAKILAKLRLRAEKAWR